MKKCIGKLRVTLISIVLCGLLAGVACITMPFRAKAAAAFVGLSGDSMSVTELFDATNTYEGAASSTVTKNGWKLDPNNKTLSWEGEVPLHNISFNMNNRIEKLVMPLPQITVLTHGWNGGAKVWSKVVDKGEDVFAYDPDSLITGLSNKAGSANIYWANMKPENEQNKQAYDAGHRDFDLINLNKQRYLRKYEYDDSAYYVPSITDVSNHIIIVFDSADDEAFNENVYYEFNYMLSKVIYDVKLANYGILPKVNLIGYSRGGLTNLMYAMDHPDLVDSLISIGAPFFGSTTGVFGRTEWGAGLLGVRQCNAIEDMSDPVKYKAYANRWNNNYNLYSGINSSAIGSYVTPTFIAEALTYNKNEAIQWVAIALAMDIEAAYSAFILTHIDKYLILNMITELFEYGFPSTYAASIAHILFQEIRFDLSGDSLLSFFSDFAVHLASQLGDSESLSGVSDYKFTNRYARLFRFNDGTEFSKQTTGVPGCVVHSFEPRDHVIIDWILNSSDISVAPVSIFTTRPMPGGLEITGVIYNVRLSGAIILPSMIYGQSIVGIGNDAFAFYDKLTYIEIPGLVTYIGERAFAFCINLTTVKFGLAGGVINYLNKIGYEAFYGCTGLKKIDLPLLLETIEELAFASTSLRWIYIPASVKEIKEYAFGDCRQLASVTFSESSVLETIGGSAFEDCTLLLDILLPDSLNSIGDYAFRNCTNLPYIIIPDINTIGGSLFSGCYLTAVYYEGSNTALWRFQSLPANAKVYYYLENKPEDSGIYWRYVKTLPTKWNDYTVTLVDQLNETSGTITATLGLPMPTGSVPVDTTGSGKVFLGYYSADGIKYYHPDMTSVRLYDLEKNTTLYSKWDNGKMISAATLIFLSKDQYETTIITFKTNSQITPEMQAVTRINVTGNPDYSLSLHNLTIDQASSTVTIRLGSSSVPEWIRTYVDKYCSFEIEFKLIYSSAVAAINGGTGYEVFQGAANQSGTVYIPSHYNGLPISQIGQAAFQNASGITGIIIPDSITVIGDYAFAGCSGLTSIKIPDSVISIGNNAFAGCSGLTSITIPSGVVSIGDYAFYECINLSTVTLPKSVIFMGYGVFNYCNNLTVYAEAVRKPADWDECWDYSDENIPGERYVVVWNSVLSNTKDYVYFVNKTSLSVSVPPEYTMSEPARDGFVFGGWISYPTGELCTGQLNSLPDGIYVAYWIEIHTVTFRILGWSGVSITVPVKNYDTVTAPEIVFSSGCVFTGWGTYDFNAPVTGDIMITGMLLKLW